MLDSFRKAFIQMRRTPYQALAAVMVLSLTFFAATIFTFIFSASHKIISYFESSPQVIAFFEKGKDLPAEEIATIKGKLQNTGKMASFKYVSTHEAESIYKDKNKSDPLLLELVDYKILPPSIEVSASSIESLGQLKDLLKSQAGVTDVVFYEDVVQTLSVWVANLRFVGLVLLIYLLLQSILILLMIVSLKIMVKKEEIEIMQFLGASFSFIAKPFVAEGVVYGILGAVFGFAAATSILLYSTPLLINWLGDLPLLPVPLIFLAQVFGVQVAAGIILGIIASVFGVKRFLRN